MFQNVILLNQIHNNYYYYYTLDSSMYLGILITRFRILVNLNAIIKITKQVLQWFWLQNSTHLCDGNLIHVYEV